MSTAKYISKEKILDILLLHVGSVTRRSLELEHLMKKRRIHIIGELETSDGSKIFQDRCNEKESGFRLKELCPKVHR